MLVYNPGKKKAKAIGVAFKPSGEHTLRKKYLISLSNA